jgi:Pentapeptide repeats (9 copies)
LAKCGFTAKYWNYERQAIECWLCDSEDEDVLDSGKCIFHDEYYLKTISFREEKKRNVIKKVTDKVEKSKDKKEALFCIGYYLPDVTIGGNFIKPVYFTKCKFQGQADFNSAEFSGGANFDSAKFSGGANFRLAKFSGGANFRLAKFSGGAYFRLAKFSGEVSFISAGFSEIAYFGSAKFSGRAIFGSAKFSESNFISAEFSELANFSS